MDLHELQTRAHVGGLTQDEIEMVRAHLCPADPTARQIARQEAIAIAGSYLERRSDAGLMFELIRIAEDADEQNPTIREAAVRALARATDYHGQPVRLDL